MVALFLLILALAVLVFVVTVALITFNSYYLTPLVIRRTMAKQGVVGPPPRLLIGNLPDISSLVKKTTATDMPSNMDHDILGRLLPHYVLWSKIYGKRFIYFYGSEPRLCLAEPELVKDFLSSKYVHISGKSWFQLQGSKHLIGQGVLMANSTWSHQRHLVAPRFMGDKLKANVALMVECTKVTMKKLAAAAGGFKEVEIGEYMTHLTADIISRTEFDMTYNKGKKIFDLLDRLQVLTAQISRHIWIPGNRFFPSKFSREIKSLKVEVEKLLTEMIESTKNAAEVGRSNSYGRGLLGQLLTESQKSKVGFSYSMQMMMDECKTIIFAGHETTALLLTWTVMLLATNPSWQERARAEVQQVCGDELPKADHLAKFTVLSMIINESLRLYPPAAMLPRMALKDMKLGDLYIPKGLSVWIPTLAIHHNKELWGEDATQFKPERFATRSFAQTRNFLPFASGPRNCLGQGYALMEAKVALSMLLSQFSFTISKNYRHAPVNVLTLKPKYGVQIYLTPLGA